MEKKVIYILSEYFAPFQNVGSVKFSKIAKYLSLTGENKIYVFSRVNSKTNDVLLENDLAEMKANGTECFYIDEGISYHAKYNKVTHFIYGCFIRGLRILIGAERYYYRVNQKSAHRFVKGGLKITAANKLPAPDLIISTYDDWGAHYLAEEFKKKYPEAKWIADFRDPIGAQIKTGRFRKLCDEYSINASKLADYVTSVSKGCLESIQFVEGTKSSVVTNGYDYSDLDYVRKEFGAADKTPSKLKFAYTGSFYGHSLMPFYQVLRELIDEGKIAAEKIEVDYAGTYGSKVFSEIEQAGLEQCYVYKGNLTRVDSIRLQDEVDVLLTTVWNWKDYQGVLGGKVLNYLMLKKPIIGIVIGDTPESDLKHLFQTVNCGWCYEQANDAVEHDVLKSVVLDCYNKKMAGSPITVDYNETELEKYNLKNIAKQYEDIYAMLKGN